jgi:hypothetical protein
MRLIIGAMTAALLTLPTVPAYSQLNGANPRASMQAPPRKEKEEKTPEQKRLVRIVLANSFGPAPHRQGDWHMASNLTPWGLRPQCRL